MIPVIDIKQRIEFISKEDKTEPKTIFVLRPLSGVEKFGVLQLAVGKNLTLEGEYITKLLEKAVVEVKNHSIEGTKEDIINSLPDSVIIELVNKIGEMNSLTENESKN